jgi:hypothetical protein
VRRSGEGCPPRGAERVRRTFRLAHPVG